VELVLRSQQYVFKTIFGLVGISYSDKGIRRLNLPVDSYEEACRLIGAGGSAFEVPPPAISVVIERIKLYFEGGKIDFLGNFDLSAGTSFQRNVWTTCRRIPYGETSNYSRLAEEIGNPKAVRAVGNALGKNPLPIIIPCHRVLAKGGGLGGFSGGIEMKKHLLQLESQNGIKQASACHPGAKRRIWGGGEGHPYSRLPAQGISLPESPV